MAKTRGAGLASIFDEPEAVPVPAPAGPEETRIEPARKAAKEERGSAVLPTQARPKAAVANAEPEQPSKRDGHPGKKGVLVHIPSDMHRVLRQLSVEENGEPITKVVERGLRHYLVQRGYTRFG